jgi:pyruvate-formate lyase-activating enzyme
MTPGARRRDDHVHLAECATCQVRDRCSGLSASYLSRRAAPPIRPITEDRARRRLSLISTVEEQIRREFVTTNRLTLEGHGTIEEHLIRVQFQCNQACRFCFVSTHLPAAGDEAVRAAIVDAGRKDVRIALTGGEPTLHPRLLEYVRLARSVSRFPVLLQTNAIRLADASLARALVDAGLHEFFISLHGATAEVSDAVTEAPGTFARTVVGIDHVYAIEGTKVTLNFVICERNLHELRPFVELVGARWPRALVNISFVAPSSDVVPRERALVPRYSDALPPLASAVEEAGRVGLAVTGFESMCGIPLCLVPTSLEKYFALAEIPDGFDGGEFVRVKACGECALNKKCYGLRRGYLSLHGDGELRPVTAPPLPQEAGA